MLSQSCLHSVMLAVSLIFPTERMKKKKTKQLCGVEESDLQIRLLFLTSKHLVCLWHFALAEKVSCIQLKRY